MASSLKRDDFDFNKTLVEGELNIRERGLYVKEFRDAELAADFPCPILTHPLDRFSGGRSGGSEGIVGIMPLLTFFL